MSGPVKDPKTGQILYPGQVGYTRIQRQQERDAAFTNPKFYGIHTSADNKGAMADLFTQYGHDPHLRRQFTANLPAQGFNMNQKPDMDFVNAVGASAIDPLNAVSATVGLFNPSARDALQGVQEKHPVGASIGGALGFGGIAAAGAKAAAKPIAKAFGSGFGTSLAIDSPQVMDWASKKLHPNYKKAGDDDE